MTYEELLKEAREKNYDLGACARIIIGDRLLLLKRASKDNYAGIWELPGGGVEKGEDPKDTILREIREEAGIQASPEEVDYVDYFEFHNIEKDMHKRKFCFQLKKPHTEPVVISHEHSEFKLFSLEDVKEILISSGVKPEGYNIWADHYKLVCKYFDLK